MQHEISSIDRMVIKILIRNSRISVKDISRQLGISQPTVKKE
ncbi:MULTISPECIES: AsnC family protein [Acidiplasma]|nr:MULTISPECIES: AsnC family protein [Acidiplasma]